MIKALVVCSVILAVLLSGCTGQKTETQPVTPVTTNNVEIKGFAFNPESITVSKGTSITWTNRDSAPHTVTGTAFGSETLNQDQSFSYTFNEAGTFEYACKIHPNMKGKVIVT